MSGYPTHLFRLSVFAILPPDLASEHCATASRIYPRAAFDAKSVRGCWQIQRHQRPTRPRGSLQRRMSERGV